MREDGKGTDTKWLASLRVTPAVVAADPHRFHVVLLRGDPTLKPQWHPTPRSTSSLVGCDEGDVKFSTSSPISSWNFFVDVRRSAFTAIRSSVLRIAVLTLCNLLFCEFRVRGPGLRSLPLLHHVDARPERMRPNRAVVESLAGRVLLTVTRSLSLSALTVLLETRFHLKSTGPILRHLCT